LILEFLMFSKEDDDNGGVLGLIFGFVALVVASVIGFGIYQANFKGKAVKAPTAVVATASVAAQAVNTPATDVSAASAAASGAAVAAGSADAASVKVENGVVKFFFASGKSEVAAGGNEALAEVVKAIASGKKAVVSGFNDATGDAVKNAELSKARAFAVRDALKALGVAEDKIELKKPENTTAAAGSSAEARRVEVSIQ
jgi:outer membrane protein OmpA-like peptidoglycan-associated protein